MRRWDVRARSVSVARLSKSEIARGRLQLELLEELEPLGPIDRPKTRGDCVDGVRPCPFVSCVHHLYLDVSPRTGAIKFNRPELEPDEMTESCALDVADRGGISLEAVGAIMNVTRERIRQIEGDALARLLASDDADELRELAGVPRGAPRKRRLPLLVR
jgi:hypothetical protein